MHKILIAYLLEVGSPQMRSSQVFLNRTCLKQHAGDCHMWRTFSEDSGCSSRPMAPCFPLLLSHLAAPWCAGCWSKAQRWSDRRAPETYSPRCSACLFGSISRCHSYCELHSSADKQTILLGSFKKRATCLKIYIGLKKVNVLLGFLKLFNLADVWPFQAAIN